MRSRECVPPNQRVEPISLAMRVPVLLFFTAMWGMLQAGMQRTGLISTTEGFDCLVCGQETFAAMRANLSSYGST